MPNKNSQPNDRPSKPRGRPPVRVMPDPIPDTPENVVRALCLGPPARDWDFLKPGGAGFVKETPTRRQPRNAV